MLWHKKGRKKENNMAAGKKLVQSAVGLALFGLTIFVAGYAFRSGEKRAK
jgi:hypothetical protein|tara:strand:+ start:471 stop:620 length:150 start_codon:yes stop_codon:yes gene_type:complete